MLFAITGPAATVIGWAIAIGILVAIIKFIAWLRKDIRRAFNEVQKRDPTPTEEFCWVVGICALICTVAHINNKILFGKKKDNKA